MKSEDLIASIAMGINVWLAPQISEHWPKYSPGRRIVKPIWFNRPGIASTFTPRDGIAQEWITSAAVINMRTSRPIGSTTRLSVSSRRYSPILRSEIGVIYESISTDMKSEYSYLQYHW